MKTALKTDITVQDICDGFVYNELEGKGLVEAGQPAHNISVMPCPAFVKGEHCTVLRVAMCPDAPCDLSRARA
jgi:hypothetical protein